MTNQLFIFDETIARERRGCGASPVGRGVGDSRAKLPGFAKNSDTSLAAAIHIQPKVSKLQRRVLALFKRQATWTVEEAMDALGITKRNTVAPRFTELGPGTDAHPGMHLIRDSGKRRNRNTAWELNTKGE